MEEIGSEFWLDDYTPEDSGSDVPDWLSQYGDVVLTTSARGAITLLLQQVEPRHKNVLLPAYICESVILPFIEMGYSCYFYETDKHLSPDIKSVKSFENIGCFVHMGYFGFRTNRRLNEVIEQFKKQHTIIIEDITHTLFSNFERFESNDFYVGSIRKWFAIPSGGFLASNNKIKNNLLSDNTFPELRKKGLLAKGEYIKNKDENIKLSSLNQLADAESLLDKDINAYSIDKLSIDLIRSLNSNELIKKRRDNFNVLLEGIKGVNYIEIIFNGLRDNDCPMFKPIFIKGDRDFIRKRLIENKIYCPIHWPIPKQINSHKVDFSLGIYNSILSIPCDQRYDVNDMERIVDILKGISGFD